MISAPTIWMNNNGGGRSFTSRYGQGFSSPAKSPVMPSRNWRDRIRMDAEKLAQAPAAAPAALPTGGRQAPPPGVFDALSGQFTAPTPRPGSSSFIRPVAPKGYQAPAENATQRWQKNAEMSPKDVVRGEEEYFREAGGSQRQLNKARVAQGVRPQIDGRTKSSPQNSGASSAIRAGWGWGANSSLPY